MGIEDYRVGNERILGSESLQLGIEFTGNNKIMFWPELMILHQESNFNIIRYLLLLN